VTEESARTTQQSTGSARPLGRRAQRIAKTRLALTEAALELFATQGFEATSVTEIAEAAGVSRRTFFEYFPSKDDVLFGVDPAALEVLTELIVEVEPGLSDLEVLREAHLQWLMSEADLRRRRRRTLLLRRAADSSPVLLGKEAQMHAAFRHAISAAMAARRGLDRPDPRAETAARLAQGVMLLVAERWVSEPGADYRSLIREHFDLVIEMAAAAEPSTGRKRAAGRSSPAATSRRRRSSTS